MSKSCYKTLSITIALLRHLRIRKSFISEVWASKVDMVMMVPSEIWLASTEEMWRGSFLQPALASHLCMQCFIKYLWHPNMLSAQPLLCQGHPHWMLWAAKAFVWPNPENSNPKIFGDLNGSMEPRNSPWISEVMDRDITGKTNKHKLYRGLCPIIYLVDC